MRRRKSAVLFGYGNYAKTVVVPGMAPYLALECVHEIDPAQIASGAASAVSWSTSPIAEPAKYYDIYLIAGYHHTHAPLALDALRRNAHAVVEKPICVDRTQLSELVSAMTESKGRLFSCFHKRYLPFNRYAHRDLGLAPGEPISYHCIVYEVPLPILHWYLWPNSKSRLISNGCHWVDHFLYLNEFCEWEQFNVFSAKDGTINCSVTLKNGALLTMVLTDRGSERIGVQDYIELRANGRTVKMTNGARYEAEDRSRILRRAHINKMSSYKNMYRQIGMAVAGVGAIGDTVHSVSVSAGLILTLEEAFADRDYQARVPHSSLGVMIKDEADSARP